MSIEREDLTTLAPDALSPAATEAKAEAIGCTKADMPTAKCFVSAILAGAFVAFGAMYFCTFLGILPCPSEPNGWWAVSASAWDWCWCSVAGQSCSPGMFS